MNQKTLYDCRSLEELKETFSLTEIAKFAREKDLLEWLDENFYHDEIKKISGALDDEVTDAELKLLICKIFNLELSKLNTAELDEISAFVSKNQRKELFAKYADSGSNVAYVENQNELVQALKSGAEILYLYGAEFKISVEIPNKTYIGCNNAIIDFTCDNDVDLDERNIILEDLQIYIHYPITLKMDNSKNIKILNGTKKTLGVRPTLQEIFEIMRGRYPFESAQNFTRRAEDIRGAAVGAVLLVDTNYNYEEGRFLLQPQWNFEYISIFKDFAQDRNFYLNLAPKFAEQLYNNERKLQIFADFTYCDGKLTILNLYFETNTLGRIAIESILRALKKKISAAATSNFFGVGYGLDIITAYKD